MSGGMIYSTEYCKERCCADTKQVLVLHESVHTGWASLIGEIKMVPTYLWKCTECSGYMYVNFRTPLGSQVAWTKHRIQEMFDDYARSLIIDHGINVPDYLNSQDYQ